MKPIEQIQFEPISFSLSPITEKQVSDFRNATGTRFTSGVPVTFPTMFRKAEFQFLDLCEVDMRQLLHVDQEYEYVSPVEVGDVLDVSTKIESVRERRGMYFFTLKTEISAGKKMKVISITQFVVRPDGVSK